MELFERCTTILKSNIHALLDKCEDPAKVADQSLRDLREDLAQLKKEAASVMGNDRLSQKKVTDCEAEIAKCTMAAQNALKSGNEDVAKKAIEKKQGLESKLAGLKETAQQNHAMAVQVQQAHDKLVDDIKACEEQKDRIQSKMATAKSKETVSRLMSGGKKSGAGISALERMEAKADQQLAQAESMEALDAGATATDDLIDQYAEGCSTDVDDELARMKAELGL